MAKKPTDQSSGSIAPPSTGKTLAGEKKGGVNIEVPPSRIGLKGHAPEIVVVSAQAVKASSVASSTATATGHPDVAKAAEGVQVVFQNIIHIHGDKATVNQMQSFDIDQTNTVIQKQIDEAKETLTANNVPFFDCDELYERCMSQALDGMAKFKCMGLYAACLMSRATEALK